MNVEEAQQEMRSVYLGGAPGGIVSGGIWLASAALGTWNTRSNAIWMLTLGGAFIFPLTVLVLKALGRRASLRHENPLRSLAMQIAFTVPMAVPLVGAAAVHRIDWFYPAFMIVVGAHYLPFVFLYGMRVYAALCAVLVTGGLMLGLYFPMGFTAGGWLTGAIFVAFGIGTWIVAFRWEHRSA